MAYTDEMNEQRLREGGPEAIRPEDTIGCMTTDAIRAELLERLERLGVTPPQPFSAARNAHVRTLLEDLTPYKVDGGPLATNRSQLTRILVLLLELRGREIRGSA